MVLHRKGTPAGTTASSSGLVNSTDEVVVTAVDDGSDRVVISGCTLVPDSPVVLSRLWSSTVDCVLTIFLSTQPSELR